MAFIIRIFLLLLCIYHTQADYPCVCNYDTENNVYLQPSNQSQKTSTLYEFDCKPTYTDYTGTDFVAIEIEQKIGYIDAHSNIQQQICSGEASPFDLVPTTTVAPSTLSTKQVQTTLYSTKPPTTQLPTTQPPTTHLQTTRQTQVPTTVVKTQTPTTRFQTTRQATTVQSTEKTTEMKTEHTTFPIVWTTYQTVTSGPSYHTSNVTGGVLQYIGVAYNLTSGNPLAPSMVDPGLLLGNRVFQLNEFTNGTSREIEITNLTSTCSTLVTLINSGKSYQHELLALVSPTVDHPVNLTDAAFIFNKDFNKVRSHVENPNSANVYQDELRVCSEMNMRLKDELADTEPLSISRDFAKDACDLPENYDVNEYINFLDKWGTSVVTEVMLGTKHLLRFQTTIPALFNVAAQKNSSLIHHAGSYMNYASSLTMSSHDYIHGLAGSTNLGSSVATYSSTGVVPVGQKLEPITVAFSWRYWKDILGQFHATGVCKDSLTRISIQRMAENMNKTLPQYFIMKNRMSGLNLSPLMDHSLQMPVNWPKGTYGLMKPRTGCPSGQATWREGYRVQDSLSPNTHHHYSGDISNTLSGQFGSKLETQYCMKTDSTPSQYDRDWPQGNYCILKKGDCPTGFLSGSIYWDDADFINKNKEGGTLPDGSYGKNTKIYYCCRSDGHTSNPITLPVDRSFVLLRYKGACQSVYSMNVREVYIQWDSADLFNKDEDQGAHPLDDGGDEHKLHFCFYSFNTGGVIVG